ncbi:M56 family metallopeptidase [Nocardia cyriacigeorgica]|uniref:M56 family metallopeptidase n=1 Tax=Nocardia cyriacigeorgica TaxID=135487 RepID=A0A4U8VZ30_9NOCA|nr:M56 family metallopeptidase [Nocardia cyriacigeorgica]MBF6424042.1 M56 family metallopeptidase [Nocardia cyriacigeorgica]TLF56682.1 M56 family metallopeptidase [Nocardia cyriacigeorgica]TLF97854.1 M56 family metallopeptidase [Nocardia cyriacigeorgica]VFA98946.1 Peptidase family M48 [Nocardia cyriacigeorgica]
MSLAICLLVYATVVCVVSPRLLPRLTGLGSTPTAAVAAWLVALASVVASWVGAAIALTAELVRTWDRPASSILGACLAAVRTAGSGHYGFAAQIGVATFAVALSGFLMAVAVRIARALARARKISAEHARSAHIVGRRVPGVDGVVIDAPEKAAYCVAGRPGTVVVTSAAVAALDVDHLEAVLAHERAHLDGRHHLVLAVTRALANVLPRLQLFGVARNEVAQLLEMCADDRAARRHGRTTVLSAIVRLSDAPVPRRALGASSVGISARIRRLDGPVSAVELMRSRLLLSVFAAVVGASPFLAASGAVYGLAICMPLTS